MQRFVDLFSGRLWEEAFVRYATTGDRLQLILPFIVFLNFFLLLFFNVFVKGNEGRRPRWSGTFKVLLLVVINFLSIVILLFL